MNNFKGKFVAKYKTTVLPTGLETLDLLINGGFSVGSIVLIEEDYGNIHCAMLCKNMLSCGLMNNQESALIIDNPTPKIYLERLSNMNHVTSNSESFNKTPALEIAWRYKNLKNVENLPLISPEGDVSVEGINVSMLSTFHVKQDLLSENLSEVFNFVEMFIKTKGNLRKPMRIIISSLGSPLWGSYYDNKEAVNLMSQFLFCLKRIINGTFISVVVTINQELLDGFNEIKTSSILHTFSDYVFKFDAFEDPKTVGKKLHNDITGLMRPLKIPSINSLEPFFKPNTVIWSYQVLKRKIAFKEFCLPPCLSENISRTSQSNPSETINVKIGCGVDF